jgi:hypothetical protein
MNGLYGKEAIDYESLALRGINVLCTMLSIGPKR